VPETVSALFDEFAAAYAHGDRPDVRDYLHRAGDGAADLAGLVDAFLVVTIPPAPAEAARRRVHALVPKPTLLDLRTKAGVRRDRLVDEIMTTFSIESAKRRRVKQYYHDLESGLLDPSRVSLRLWDLLGRLLGAEPSTLAHAAPPDQIVEGAYFRSEVALQSAPPEPVRAEEPDDVDQLFTSGP